MNAATAQMVTLTGQGDETDHNAVGAAVNTISTNLADMAREGKMLAALMDDKSAGVEGDDLMGAARTLCGAFSEMLTSAAPKTNEVRFLQKENRKPSPLFNLLEFADADSSKLGKG